MIVHGFQHTEFISTIEVTLIILLVDSLLDWNSGRTNSNALRSMKKLFFAPLAPKILANNLLLLRSAKTSFIVRCWLRELRPRLTQCSMRLNSFEAFYQIITSRHLCYRFCLFSNEYFQLLLSFFYTFCAHVIALFLCRS